MAKIKEKQKAIGLRRAGKSYSQIKQLVGVSKSTLSYWLKDMPLPDDKMRILRDWNENRIEKFRNTMRQKREARLTKIYSEEKINILPLSERELFLAGLFLYWGEGGKTAEARLVISNTNPAVIKFFIRWLSIFKVPKEKLRIYVHLYKDMNIKKELNFWAKTLGIPLQQFQKPYIKNSAMSGLTYKNGFNHGTCNAMIGDARLSERVLMGIKALSDHIMET
ncbi:MAG: helix-turn-helix domain-containing protein [bacterium]|nr:helix-turn-helix domain-containing protein [bacterium]